MATKPLFVNIRLDYDAAEYIRRESDRRQITATAMTAETVLDGIHARTHANGESDLERIEHRLAASNIALRGEIERIAATTEMLFSFLDAFAKMLLIRLPDPASTDIPDAVLAAATAAYDRLIKSAVDGVDNRERPRALVRMVDALQKTLETHRGVVDAIPASE